MNKPIPSHYFQDFIAELKIEHGHAASAPVFHESPNHCKIRVSVCEGDNKHADNIWRTSYCRRVQLPDVCLPVRDASTAAFISLQITTIAMGWKESDIPDLTGRIAIVRGNMNILGSSLIDHIVLHVQVTGGNGGLGYENCRALHKAGATVIMASRNQEKCETVAQNILKANKDCSAETVSQLALYSSWLK